MANKKQLQILRSGVEAWNAWREENPGVKIDLSGAELCGANLIRANLGWAKESGNG